MTSFQTTRKLRITTKGEKVVERRRVGNKRHKMCLFTRIVREQNLTWVDAGVMFKIEMCGAEWVDQRCSRLTAQLPKGKCWVIISYIHFLLLCNKSQIRQGTIAPIYHPAPRHVGRWGWWGWGLCSRSAETTVSWGCILFWSHPSSLLILIVGRIQLLVVVGIRPCFLVGGYWGGGGFAFSFLHSFSGLLHLQGKKFTSNPTYAPESFVTSHSATSWRKLPWKVSCD